MTKVVLTDFAGGGEAAAMATGLARSRPGGGAWAAEIGEAGAEDVAVLVFNYSRASMQAANMRRRSDSRQWIFAAVAAPVDAYFMPSLRRRAREIFGAAEIVEFPAGHSRGGADAGAMARLTGAIDRISQKREIAAPPPGGRENCSRSEAAMVVGNARAAVDDLLAQGEF